MTLEVLRKFQYFFLQICVLGTFNWTVKEQGYVLSSFFYGSGLTQFPSGIIASKFGGKLSFAIGVVGTGICTFLTPTFAFIGVYELCALRFLMGILQGLVFTSMNHLMGVWVPEFERSFYSALVGGAADIGNIFSPIIAGYLCSLDFMHGWPLSESPHPIIANVQQNKFKIYFLWPQKCHHNF